MSLSRGLLVCTGAMIAAAYGGWQATNSQPDTESDETISLERIRADNLLCDEGPSVPDMRIFSLRLIKHYAHNPDSVELAGVQQSVKVRRCQFSWFVAYRANNDFGALTLSEAKILAIYDRVSQTWEYGFVPD